MWTVYILLCSDHSLYTGITTNLEKRLATHNKGTGAKYLRSKLPATLVYQEPQVSRSNALKREYAIKQLTKDEKLDLIHTVARNG